MIGVLVALYLLVGALLAPVALRYAPGRDDAEIRDNEAVAVFVTVATIIGWPLLALYWRDIRDEWREHRRR